MPRTERTPYEIACAERAKTLADRKGITQDDIAEQLGMTQGAVGQYFNGPLKINVKFMLKLCRVLRCAPSVIDPEKKIFDLFTPEEDHIVDLLRSADPAEYSTMIRVLEGLSKK